MPNPIKYSTTSEPLSLNKGNFNFNVGDPGSGPSDTTGYYNGFPPYVGGYIIYISGNDNNGTLLNGTQYVSDGNGSWSFDGVNDYCGLLFTYNTQNTVSFWIKFTGLINFDRAIIDMGNITPSFRIYLQNQKVKVQYTAAFGDIGLSSTNNVITNTWVNYTITNIGSNTSIYMNGILDNSGIIPSSPRTTESQLGIASKPTGSTLSVGRVNATTLWWSGNISQTSIYNRVLTQTEITTIYNVTKSRYGIQ